MRVLHVINTLLRAGAEVFLIDLAVAQVAAGAHVEVAVLGEADEELARVARAAGARVHVWNLNIYTPVCAMKLRNLLVERAFDVLNAHLAPAQYWLYIAAAATAMKPVFVATEHSTYNRRQKFVGIRQIDRVFYAKCSAVICNSEATLQSFHGWMPKVATPVFVIHNGINLSRIAAAPAGDLERISGLKRPIILCVGRLRPEKGQDLLIEALALAPGLSLLLAGQGDALDEWQALAVRLKVQDRVRFLGVSDNVYSLMKGCDVYAQPSRWEGFGIAALEALACGARVVAARVPGLREIVGTRGRLFEPNDVRSLVACVNEALDARDNCAGPRDWLRQYSIDDVAVRYIGLYRELLAARHG